MAKNHFSMNGIDMPDELKGILKEFITKLHEAEVDEEIIGTLPAPLIAAFKEHSRAKDKLHDEKCDRAEQVAHEAKIQLKKEFAQRDAEMEAIKDGLWERVYQEFNLKDEGSYSIDRKNWYVTKEVPKTKPTVSKMM